MTGVGGAGVGVVAGVAPGSGLVAGIVETGRASPVGADAKGTGAANSGASAIGVGAGPSPVMGAGFGGGVVAPAFKPIASDTVFGLGVETDGDTGFVGNGLGLLMAGAVVATVAGRACKFGGAEVGGPLTIGALGLGALNRKTCPTRMRPGSASWFQRASSR